MVQDIKRNIEGIRGYVEDASGNRWTAGVNFLVSGLVTLWVVQMFLKGWKMMPLSAGETALKNMGIELPWSLAHFTTWVSNSGSVFIAILFVSTLLLALRDSYQSCGSLYASFTWISLMLLFEATGTPVLTFLGLMGALAVLALLAYLNSLRVKNHSIRSGTRDKPYFGQCPPKRVLERIYPAMCAPIVFGAALLRVVSRAFSFGNDNSFRVVDGFSKYFEKLQANDPKAAESLRLDVLLRAAETGPLSFEMEMIVHHLLSDPLPAGALRVTPDA